MTNTNCLEGFERPNCKSDGPFKITVQQIVLMYDDGTDIDAGSGCSAEFSNHDPCECPMCGHHCTVIDFKPAERGNGEDFDIEDRSTADLIYMILDTLGDVDMTTDDIIDNTTCPTTAPANSRLWTTSSPSRAPRRSRPKP